MKTFGRDEPVVVSVSAEEIHTGPHSLTEWLGAFFKFFDDKRRFEIQMGFFTWAATLERDAVRIIKWLDTMQTEG